MTQTQVSGGSGHPAEGDVDATTALREGQAAALGRAGKQVAAAVARYREVRAGVRDDVRADDLLDEIAADVYRLLIQRECAGARSDNLTAIARAYDVPPAALRRL